MKKQEIPLRISPVKIHLMTSYDGIMGLTGIWRALMLTLIVKG